MAKQKKDLVPKKNYKKNILISLAIFLLCLFLLPVCISVNRIVFIICLIVLSLSLILLFWFMFAQAFDTVKSDKLYNIYKLLSEESNIKKCTTKYEKEKVLSVAARVRFRAGKASPEEIFTAAEQVWQERTGIAQKLQKEKEEQLSKNAKMEEILSRCENYPYKNKVGRAKLTAIVSDQLAAQYKNLSTANTVRNLGIQKETNSALMGGIASGIAGPAAGLSEALRTEQENAVIREQNEAWKQKVGTPVAAIELEAQSAIRKLTKEKERIKSLYVDTSFDADALFEDLNISVSSPKVSENNTLFFDATIKPKKLPKISDNLFGRIDGTITGEFFDEKHKSMGRVWLVLPQYGVGKSGTTVTGCSDENCDVKPGDYTVALKAKDLWIIEP